MAKQSAENAMNKKMGQTKEDTAKRKREAKGALEIARGEGAKSAVWGAKIGKNTSRYREPSGFAFDCCLLPFGGGAP